MNTTDGGRARTSMAAVSGRTSPAALERKGGATERQPATIRLNGRQVQVVLNTGGTVPLREERQAGRVGACRQLTQAAVQVLWSFTPWAQPEPKADDGAAHYLALARKLVGQPPTDAQLQSFVTAVVAEEGRHGFFRPPLAQMRAAYAALAQVLDLPSADAGLLGRVINALQAADTSRLHRVSAAEALARAIGAQRLAPRHLDHLLRVLDPGESADPGWHSMLMGMLCQVCAGPQMQPAQLTALVRAIFSPQRAGRDDAPVRRAQFQALVQGIGLRVQVQVPGRLWGQRSVTQVQGLTQAQVTQVVRSVLAPWRPDAMAMEQAMGEIVLALDACLPEPARYQAHHWIAQVLIQHFLDPRSPLAGVPYLPGMSESTLKKQAHDITAVGCIGLAAALLSGQPNDTDSRLALMAAELVEPALRACPRLPATRLRPMAHYQFASALAGTGTRGLSGALMNRQLPTRALLTPVLARIGRLSLQQAGAWIGGVFGSLAVLEVPRGIRLGEADSFRMAIAFQLLALTLEQMLAASAGDSRLSRVALVGYEVGGFLVKGRCAESAMFQAAVFVRSLGDEAFTGLPDDRKVALMAGLAMALLQRFPDAQDLEELFLDNLPEPPEAGPGSPGPAQVESSSRGASMVRPARVAQVRLLADAMGIARHPERVLADPRFAAGDDALEMLLLARAMPQASGADDLNHAVGALARLEVPPGVLRQALARVAGQRGTELTPANFARVHRAMLELLLEASARPAGPKDDSKREVRSLDENEGQGLRFEPAEPLLQFYEDLRECSGLMFAFCPGEIDRAQLRASEPAIGHLLALLDLAQADIRTKLQGPRFIETRALLEGTLEKIRQPLQQALQGLSTHAEKKAK